MIENTLGVLEYDKVKALLARLTATGPGRSRVMQLAPLDSRELVIEALAEVTEMAALLEAQGSPPVGGSLDLRQSLRALSAEGTWLGPEALMEVLSSIGAASDCRRYFCGREEAPRLSELASSLTPLGELARNIASSIGGRGEILDGASFALATIRQEFRRTRVRIKSALEALLASEGLAGVFQERIITERGGRYVLPVRADHRGRVKGFVHDESSSGQTLYVEPESVLKGNNEVQALLREEKREEERILRRLSDEVRASGDALRANQEILAHLDYKAAAGRFSRLADGVAPELSVRPSIELNGARHPLLLFNGDATLSAGAAVPIDILLGQEHDALVVSGPNTGGKSVALKTAGLLVLMVRSGLHVPCSPGSRVYPFGKVFADIGDQQSIEESLSTFSGHLTRVGRILREADGDSLVLLDEAGTGTDPAEGAALALAVIDTLRERGTRTVVTTHLNQIKAYAYQQEGVQNAAVEFDEKTLAPSYRLHYGIPGASNAFTIARLYGLPESLLERAGGYLGGTERDGLELVEKLNSQSLLLERELSEASLLKRAAEREREKRRKLLGELEDQKKVIREKAMRKAEALVREAERSFKLLLKEARGGASDARERTRLAEEFKSVKEKLSPLRSEPRRQGPAPAEVRKGEILRITALGAEGEVVRVLDREAELSVAGKKLRLSFEKLEQFSPRRFAGKKRGKAGFRGSIERGPFEPRLVVVGKRVDEALPMIERFIDDALLQGQEELQVVHGSGEGILRRAVREALAANPEVQSFHAADLAQGGDNVTLFKLRRS